MADVEETTIADNRRVVWDTLDEHKKDQMFYLMSIALPMTIFSGVVLNVLAFVILARCRLWLKHEGYLYLAAIFITNVGVLLFTTSSFCAPSRYILLDRSRVVCKLWNFLRSIFFASGWPSVAILLTCYLRAGFIRSERCFPAFAAKYCTLYASKVVVGIVIGTLLLLGLPYLVLFDVAEGSFCTGKPYVASAVSRLVETILMFALPFIALIVILLLPVCTSKKGNSSSSNSSRPGSVQSEETAADKQMRKMAITISSLILLSQFVVIAARTFGRGIKGYPPIVELVHGLTLSIHPVLCFVILTAFRQGARSQLRCCLRPSNMLHFIDNKMPLKRYNNSLMAYTGYSVHSCNSARVVATSA